MNSLWEQTAVTWALSLINFHVNILSEERLSFDSCPYMNSSLKQSHQTNLHIEKYLHRVIKCYSAWKLSLFNNDSCIFQHEIGIFHTVPTVICNNSLLLYFL